jgi:hypothetical protein
MAGMSGVGGNIAMSGCIGGVIKSWTANLTRPSTDITGFGNATKNRAVGIIDLTGSMSGSLDTGTSPTVAFSGNTAAVSLTLGCSGPGTTLNYLQFDAIIDSISIGVAVDGEATFSANFGIASTATSFAGAVTVSW